MAAPQFTLTYIDGTEEVVKMLPKQQIQYEVEKKKSLRDEAQSLKEVYELAYYAAGKPGTFDDFIDRLESVEAVEQEDREAPLGIEE